MPLVLPSHRAPPPPAAQAVSAYDEPTAPRLAALVQEGREIHLQQQALVVRLALV